MSLPEKLICACVCVCAVAGAAHLSILHAVGSSIIQLNMTYFLLVVDENGLEFQYIFADLAYLGLECSQCTFI